MKKILLVEDDHWQVECFKKWLGDKFNIIVAGDAQAALDKLDNHGFDLVILDLFLPSANGIQLLNTLASHVDLMNVPVIVCSSLPPKFKVNWRQYNVVNVVDKTTLDRTTLIKLVSHATLAK